MAEPSEQLAVTCDPREVALKSFFLGPQAEGGPWVRALVDELLEDWFAWRRALHPGDGRAISAADLATPEFEARRRRTEAALRGLIQRFADEVPKFSPRYVGHMFSEVSLPALLGHLVALLHNPNTISGESARVGAVVEDEAVRALLGLVGFDPATGRGHFTSGGTVANLEALLRARARCARWLAASACAGPRSPFAGASLGWEAYRALGVAPEAARPYDFLEAGPWASAEALGRAFGAPFRGPVVLVPRHRHYSWRKGASALGLGDEALWEVALDARGHLSLEDLAQKLERARDAGRPVALVVSVAGTTELGGLDPVGEVQDLLDSWRVGQGVHLWHHVDAAYGGFFRALGAGAEAALGQRGARALSALARADSITLDPHKLGYVPYASGAFLCRGGEDYAVQRYLAPYVQADPSRDRGPYTLEGSRSASGAAATWLTERAIGFDAEGYGRILARTVQIKQALEARLAQAGPPFRVAPHTDTNILGLALALPGEPVSAANARTQRAFAALAPGAGGPFTVAKTHLRWSDYRAYLDAFVGAWGGAVDAGELVLLRLVLMNPFFGSKEMSVRFDEELVRALRAAAGLA